MYQKSLLFGILLIRITFNQLEEQEKATVFRLIQGNQQSDKNDQIINNKSNNEVQQDIGQNQTNKVKEFSFRYKEYQRIFPQLEINTSCNITQDYIIAKIQQKNSSFVLRQNLISVIENTKEIASIKIPKELQETFSSLQQKYYEIKSQLRTQEIAYTLDQLGQITKDTITGLKNFKEQTININIDLFVFNDQQIQIKNLLKNLIENIKKTQNQQINKTNKILAKKPGREKLIQQRLLQWEQEEINSSQNNSILSQTQINDLLKQILMIMDQDKWLDASESNQIKSFINQHTSKQNIQHSQTLCPLEKLLKFLNYHHHEKEQKQQTINEQKLQSLQMTEQENDQQEKEQQILENQIEKIEDPRGPLSQSIIPQNDQQDSDTSSQSATVKNENEENQEIQAQEQQNQARQPHNFCCAKCKTSHQHNNKTCVCVVPRSQRRVKLPPQGCRICGCEGCTKEDREYFNQDKDHKETRHHRKRSLDSSNSRRSYSDHSKEDIGNINNFQYSQSIQRILQQYQTYSSQIGIGIPERTESYLLGRNPHYSYKQQNSVINCYFIFGLGCFFTISLFL